MYLLRMKAFIFRVDFFFFTKRTRCSRQLNLPFEKSEEIWIILNSQNKSSIEIRGAYIIAINKTNIPFHAQIHFNALSNISGRHTPEPRSNPFRADARKHRCFGVFWRHLPLQYLTSYLGAQELKSSRAQELKSSRALSFSAIWTIIRNNLKWKPYHFKRGQKLSSQDKYARVNFCT